MIKTVLLTGATGFIGSHLLEGLLEKKFKVVILKRSFSDTWRIEEFLDKTKSYDLDKIALESAFKENKVDCVIHLATEYIKRHESSKDVEKIIDTNVRFPSLLCQSCLQYGVNYFINTGTFFEYKIQKRPISEGDEKQAYNLYAASKLAFSEILKFYSQNYNLRIVDLRLFAPFGEKDNEKLIVFLIKSLLRGTKIEFSGGEQRWNFTYVKDIVSAYIAALSNFGKITGYEDFNVGYNEAHSIKEVAKKLEKIAKDKKFMIVWGAKPYISNEIFYVNCDNSKIKKILKWKPVFNIDSGLKATYNYYLKKFREEE
jgi:nucleoside-diphosphate-sugar epimerase